jgi:hypothetical protein
MTILAQLDSDDVLDCAENAGTKTVCGDQLPSVNTLRIRTLPWLT